MNTDMRQPEAGGRWELKNNRFEAVPPIAPFLLPNHIESLVRGQGAMTMAIGPSSLLGVPLEGRGWVE